MSDYSILNKTHILWLKGMKPKEIHKKLNLTSQQVKDFGNQTNSLEAGALAVLRGIKHNINLGLSQSIDNMLNKYEIPASYKELCSLYMDYKDILSSEFVEVLGFASGYPLHPPFFDVKINDKAPWFAIGWWWLALKQKPKVKELNNFLIRHQIASDSDLKNLKLSFDMSGESESEEEELEEEETDEESCTVSKMLPVRQNAKKMVFEEPKQKYIVLLEEQMAQEQKYIHKLIRELSTADKRVEELRMKLEGLKK